MKMRNKIRVIETHVEPGCVQAHGSVEAAVDEALGRVRKEAIAIIKKQPRRTYSIECNRVLGGARE